MILPDIWIRIHAFLSIAVVASASAAEFRPDVYEVQLNENRAYLIGVTHLSTFPSEWTSRVMNQTLRNADALALEADPTNAYNWAFRAAFEDPQEHESFKSLPLEIKACAQREIVDIRQDNKSKDLIKSLHISVLLFEFALNPAFKPNITIYEGVEFAALHAAKQKHTAIVEIENPLSALIHYRRLPISQIHGALRRYCDLLSNQSELEVIRETFKLEAFEYANGYREEHRTISDRVQWRFLGQYGHHLKISDARNELMASNIRQKVISSFRCSIVLVGGYHLTGTQSIQNWLMRSGAKVKKLDAKAQSSPCA
jgi:uncharacterized protein YbaP (TraB family)